MLLKSVLKWVKRIVFIIKLFLYGMARTDLMMEVDYNEEMKRALFEKKKT